MVTWPYLSGSVRIQDIRIIVDRPIRCLPEKIFIESSPQLILLFCSVADDTRGQSNQPDRLLLAGNSISCFVTENHGWMRYMCCPFIT